jgi:hypothetical protein
MRTKLPLPFVLAALAVVLDAAPARSDALAKLQPDKLKAVREAIQELKAKRQPPGQSRPYKDYRANLHVHSGLSHDSRGTIAEIVAAAKATGTQVLLFTEHPADHYDFFTNGHKGTRDGVLLIPGAETMGLLVFPTRSVRGVNVGSPQEFADLVRGRGGLAFLSHLEERMDWEIRGLTGTEIYNTHADFKDEKKLMAALRNPLWLLQMADLFRKYPQETFSALLDYPADYLKRWDQLCEKTPHTGIAANDAHQNVGLVVRLLEGDKARIEDALGKKLFDVPVASVAVLQALRKEKKAGDVLYELRLDPYEVSLRHVGTHLLMTELTEKAVRQALEAGRAFVAFDWLADASGFDFVAVSGARRHEMGSRPAFTRDLTLRAQAPLPVAWKVLQGGKVVFEATGRKLETPVAEPGNYRVEAWLEVAGEKVIWILSNPVYVRAAAERPSARPTS